MQLSATFSFLTLVSIATAAKSFGLLTIRSGTDLQYNAVSPKDDYFVASASGDSPTFILNDDGSLVDSDTKKYITINDKKLFVPTDKADKQFSISEDTNLAYKGSTSFFVASDKKINVGDGSGVVLYLAGQKDVSNLYPGTSTSSTKSAAPKTTTTKAATTTKVATTLTTATAKPTEAPAAKGETKFGVVAIASGTKFQYAEIKKVDSHPHVFSVAGNEGKDVEFTLKSDGTLVDQDGRGVNLDSNTGELGSVAPFGREAPTKGFSIVDGHLAHDGNQNWYVVPSGVDKYSLSNKDSTGATAIVLRVESN